MMVTTLHDEFDRLLGLETVLGLETAWILPTDTDDWECIQHDGCRPV